MPYLLQAPGKHYPVLMIFTKLLKPNLIAIAIAFTLTAPASLFAEVINLDNKNITHINFKRIKPNHFDIKDNVVTIRVNNSASFLLLSFKEVRKINTVSFEWKKRGVINIKDARQEETRRGDDAYLRIGLIIEGKASFINPLTPRWVKKVRETLHHSSNKIIYIVPGSMHKNGQHWQSPYSKNVEIIAAGSKAQADGWNISEHTFRNTQSVVGLWIMADGDNTRSTFTSRLKALTLE